MPRISSQYGQYFLESIVFVISNQYFPGTQVGETKQTIRHLTGELEIRAKGGE